MDHGFPVIVCTDASSRGLGAFILVGPRFLPFACYSANLTSTQRRYNIPELETLAGYHVFHRFYPVLRGASCIIWLCDHLNVAWFVAARLDVRSHKIGRQLAFVDVTHIAALPPQSSHIVDAMAGSLRIAHRARRQKTSRLRAGMSMMRLILA